MGIFYRFFSFSFFFFFLLSVTNLLVHFHLLDGEQMYEDGEFTFSEEMTAEEACEFILTHNENGIKAKELSVQTKIDYGFFIKKTKKWVDRDKLLKELTEEEKEWVLSPTTMDVNIPVNILMNIKEISTYLKEKIKNELTVRFKTEE